jgi:hypothetical protein
MEGTNYEFGVGDRVKLKDIPPEFYGGWACVGNEATIKGLRKDQYGLPEVYIEWDKNHWAYNNARDGWTFQEHFDLMEKGMSEDEKRKLRPSFGRKRNQEAAEKQLPLEPQSKREQVMSTPTSVEDAKKLIDQAESFVIIAVVKEDDPKVPKGILIPVAYEHAKTPESELVAQMATTQFAAKAHQELAIHAITALGQGDESGR